MPPLTLLIKPVSGACNMRCRYCFYTDVMAHRETPVYARMSDELLETLVRRAMAYADGSVSFAFQGGEPTLAGLPFYEKLVKLQKAYNARGLQIHNALQTNGYDLTDDMIAFFAREGFLLGLSMDGDRETHDRMRPDAAGRPTFDRVAQTAERLQSAGVQFNILCVVNEHVARRPREVFEALAPYRYLQFIACLDDFDGSRQNYSLTEESYLAFLKTTFDLYDRAFWAGRPVSVRNFDNYVAMLMGAPPENCAMRGQCGPYFVVESDGGVYPCDFYVLDEWRLGSVCDANFRRLAASPPQTRFRQESLPLPEPCRGCRWYPLCRNGCKRERDPLTGLNRWCHCFRAFFEYACVRMERMAGALEKQG